MLSLLCIRIPCRLYLEAQFLAKNCRRLELTFCHVSLAIRGGSRWQRAKWIRQKIYDGVLEIRKVISEFSHPLNSNETRSHHQDSSVFGIEIFDCGVLFQDVSAPTFNEALIDVGPRAVGLCCFMNCGKP